jgi:starvation-inducible DNA-binding protein
MSNNNLKTRLYASRIDFSAETRQEIAAILNATLATTLDLKTQVKQAHWNVKGMNFYSLHLLFDEMAGELEGYVDMVGSVCENSSHIVTLKSSYYWARSVDSTGV